MFHNDVFDDVKKYQDTMERQFDVAMDAADLLLKIVRGQNQLLVRCRLMIEEMHGSIYKDDLDWNKITRLYDELIIATDEGNREVPNGQQ